MPHLLEELQYRAPLASQVESLLFVLVRMKRLGYFDAASDPELLGKIEERVNVIGGPEARAWSKELLEELGRGDQ